MELLAKGLIWSLDGMRKEVKKAYNDPASVEHRQRYQNDPEYRRKIDLEW